MGAWRAVPRAPDGLPSATEGDRFQRRGEPRAQPSPSASPGGAPTRFAHRPVVRLRQEQPLRGGDDPRARWGLGAQFPAPLKSTALRMGTQLRPRGRQEAPPAEGDRPGRRGLKRLAALRKGNAHPRPGGAGGLRKGHAGAGWPGRFEAGTTWQGSAHGRIVACCPDSGRVQPRPGGLQRRGRR
ncbi:hypothetical protein SBRY_30382 [Actinacidiphila bryophytorum]|uniref:Uncharacterized protein n=1 Tax=Actinacidiphila bryophytorum TaxID=1436133 RepID=A0A9W4H0X3_9ACTN|nr:hypothetical protein SBRY_30382 [Actinacidiphila bryophytorum]